MSITWKNSLAYIASAGCLAFGACGSDEPEGQSGAAAAALVSDAVFIPNEGPALENPSTDTSITLMPTNSGSSGTPHQVSAGGSVSVQLPFSAPNKNVVGAGIRFGDNGPIRTVMVSGAQGQTGGMLQFAAQLPSDICDNLSSICHDIKCYEFAITSAGQVSRANINNIAVMCGNCDEPSCRELLDSCPSAPTPGGMTCSPASDCGTGRPIMYCVAADLKSCYYTVGSQKFSCGNCQDAAAIQACAERAVDACVEE